MHVIVLPGGGYAEHAPHEAEPIVDWLTGLGLESSVFRYPLQVRHPAPADIASFLGSIEGGLDRAATAHPNPGRVPLIHRLNRTEYRHAIRDLLAVDALPKEMDISLLLPPDEIGEGFDNMAAALFVSPSLIERYVGAARKISRLAVGDLAVPRMIDTYQLSGQLPPDVHLEELPLGTAGSPTLRVWPESSPPIRRCSRVWSLSPAETSSTSAAAAARWCVNSPPRAPA